MAGSDHVDTYYAATANSHPGYPRLQGRRRADVCVIGAGYTGLSAALHLAERGFDVTVLEANRVGWGASGRNGGQVDSGFAPGMTRTVKLVGIDHAGQLWHLAEEAKALVAERVARHRIDCDLRPGNFYAAAKRRHLAELGAEHDLLREQFGYREVALIDREETRARLGTDRFAGAMHDRAAGHLHPLNYALGLAEAAVAAGARLFEGAPARAIEGGAKPVVATDGGAVRADHVIIATNAYLGDLVAPIGRRIMPVTTYILATEPLGRDRAAALIPGGEAVSDSNFVLDYFRLAADTRMLFGGRASYPGGVSQPNLAQLMRRRMLATYPDLADLRIAHVWGGHVAITRNRLPDLGRLDGPVYYAQGYSGHGVALAGLAGKLVAEAVAGTAERFDVFARIAHRDFPGGRHFRRPLLALATTWYRLRDLI